MVNGQEVEGELHNGYLTIDRKWKKNDVVEIHFDMLPRLVKANEKVAADRGRVAVERGLHVHPWSVPPDIPARKSSPKDHASVSASPVYTIFRLAPLSSVQMPEGYPLPARTDQAFLFPSESLPPLL